MEALSFGARVLPVAEHNQEQKRRYSDEYLPTRLRTPLLGSSDHIIQLSSPGHRIVKWELRN